MYWVSWDDRTKPKSGGGLSLRDIQLFNQALLAKQAWRLLTNPRSLLAIILLGKYCQKQFLLQVEAPTACSHGWRSILHGRDLLRGHIGKAIGNGKTTKVWKDSWMSLTEQMKPNGPIPEAQLDLTVADLLTDELKWNTKKIEEVLPQFSMKIQCLRPSQIGAEDIHIWQPTKSGIYSMKSGYSSAALNRNSSQNQPNEDFDWKRDIWASVCSPKIKVFIWSIIQRALPLGENLQSRGIQDQAVCVRCKEKETTMHVFFHCPFAKEVWSKIPLHRVVHIATTTSFKKAIVAFRKSTCLPPTGIVGTILPWICWTLWTTRNTLIFDNRYISHEEVIAKAGAKKLTWRNQL